MSNVKSEIVTSIEELPPTNDWVYDVEMMDQSRPYFFGNDILVHNSAYALTNKSTVEEAIAYADEIAAQVNASFPEFMRQTFLCTPGFDDKIKSGRELVSDNGIFVDKKRYIIHIVDLEGKRVDKMKTMGLDTKKTTLPREVSKKLNGYIEQFLKGKSWESIAREIVDYRTELSENPDIMQIGLPKGVNDVEDYTQLYEQQGLAARLPGHVASSIHWNILRKQHGDNVSLPITSGMKIRNFYLKTPKGKFKGIAVPTDIEVLPEWFIEHIMPDIDKESQLVRLIDNPISNIVKAIGKTAPSKQSLYVDDILVF